jgi:hypothetical protein
LDFGEIGAHIGEFGGALVAILDGETSKTYYFAFFETIIDHQCPGKQEHMRTGNGAPAPSIHFE